jgi:uncharacterized Tic20 family protein
MPTPPTASRSHSRPMKPKLSFATRCWGMACHLAALPGFLGLAAVILDWSPELMTVLNLADPGQHTLAGVQVPIALIVLLIALWLAQIVGLVIALGFWLLARNIHPFVRQQGYTVLQFLLSMIALTGVLALLLLAVLGQLFSTSTPSSADLFLRSTVMTILCLLLFLVAQISAIGWGAIKALRGQIYRYPLILSEVNSKLF